LSVTMFAVAVCVRTESFPLTVNVKLPTGVFGTVETVKVAGVAPSILDGVNENVAKEGKFVTLRSIIPKYPFNEDGVIV